MVNNFSSTQSKGQTIFTNIKNQLEFDNEFILREERVKYIKEIQKAEFFTMNVDCKVQDLLQEKEELELQNLQYQNTIKLLSFKNKDFKEDAESLRKKIKELNDQNQTRDKGLKRKCEQDENGQRKKLDTDGTSKIEFTEQKLTLLRQKNDLDILKKYNALKSKCEKIHKDLIDNETAKKAYKKSTEKLQEELEISSKIIEDQKKINDDLNKKWMQSKDPRMQSKDPRINKNEEKDKKINELEKEMEKLKKELQMKSDQLTKSSINFLEKDKIRDLEENRRKLLDDKQLLEDQLKKTVQKNMAKEDECNELKERLKNQQMTISKSNENNGELQEKIKILNEEIDQLKIKILNEKESKLKIENDLNLKIQELNSANQSEMNKVMNLENELKTRINKIESLNTKIKEKADKTVELENKLNQFVVELKFKEECINELKNAKKNDSIINSLKKKLEYEAEKSECEKNRFFEQMARFQVVQKENELLKSQLNYLEIRLRQSNNSYPPSQNIMPSANFHPNNFQQNSSLPNSYVFNNSMTTSCPSNVIVPNRSIMMIQPSTELTKSNANLNNIKNNNP